MTAPADPSLRPPGPGWAGPAILVLLALSLLPEIVLSAADWGLWEPDRPGLRQRVYHYGAFWPGLLDDWRPNYAAQPAVMFLTYGFLHAGFWHLALNMITLVSLGQLLVERLGQRRFLLLYALSILGGAGGYALLYSGEVPMVGASGALFGLAAGVIGADTGDRIERGDPMAVILRILGQSLAGLILLNVLMYWAMGGRLAWQTHLGGFLAGWVTIVFLDRPADRLRKD